MSWEAVAAIGQAVSAVGVLVLVIQIWLNTHAVRSTAADAALTQSREWIRLLVENADLSRIFGVGQDDPATLGEEERRRYVYLVTLYLSLAENIHYHYLEGTLGQDLWETWRTKLANTTGATGMRAIWKLRRHTYSAAFQKFIDEIHARAPVESTPDTIRRLGEGDAGGQPADPGPASGGEVPSQDRADAR